MKNLTQHELADFADLSYSHLNEIELGKRDPQATTVYRIAFALGINPAVLFLNREEAIRVAKQIGLADEKLKALTEPAERNTSEHQEPVNERD